VSHLLDSDVLIDYTRHNRGAVEYIDRLPDRFISQVTTMELIVGARDKRELAYLDDLFSELTVLPLSAAIGPRAYELLRTYTKSQGLHVFDSLIAATALEEGLTVATKNRKHFEMIRDLRVDVPAY
jgi:predicted nucleic acid-binding protein